MPHSSSDRVQGTRTIWSCHDMSTYQLCQERRKNWNVTESGYNGNGQDWFQQFGSAPNCRHTGTLPTTGIKVSRAEECTDERELARAVVRAEAVLVASRSLSAAFYLCFFLYFSVGSHSCGCSVSTVSFRVECDEGSAMTGTQHSWPVWCCSMLETLAETAVRRSTTCRELFVVRCGVDLVFEAWWRRRGRTCGGDGSPVEGGGQSSFVEFGDGEPFVRAAVLEGGMASRLSWSCWRCAVGSRFGGRQKPSCGRSFAVPSCPESVLDAR